MKPSKCVSCPLARITTGGRNQQCSLYNKIKLVATGRTAYLVIGKTWHKNMLSLNSLFPLKGNMKDSMFQNSTVTGAWEAERKFLSPSPYNVSSSNSFLKKAFMFHSNWLLLVIIREWNKHTPGNWKKLEPNSHVHNNLEFSQTTSLPLCRVAFQA